MKLFVIIDETSFYHPQFLSDFLHKTYHEVVGAGLVTRIPKKNSLARYLMSHWYFMQFGEIAKLATRKLSCKMKDLISFGDNESGFCSARSVLEYYGISYFPVKNDINQEGYLEKIRACDPDIIISSNSLPFKERLLNLPRLYCINRHSSMLPAYGGLWPVFQAYRNGESYTGVSIHTMEPKIDQGIVVAQRKLPIRKGQTLSYLYEQCFSISSDLLCEALEKIVKNEMVPVENDYSPSYYSFPTKSHWKDFRKNAGRII